MTDIVVDATSLKDIGFDKFLSRTNYGKQEPVTGFVPRQVRSDNIIGGLFGDQSKIDLGSGNIRIDAKNKRIIINDGQYDRVLIGYQRAGF